MDEAQLITSCRTCLKDGLELKPLTTKWNNTIEFWEMLLYLMDLDHAKSIPVKICYSCEVALISSYSFKKMCLETEQFLSNVFIERDEYIDDVNSDLAAKLESIPDDNIESEIIQDQTTVEWETDNTIFVEKTFVTEEEEEEESLTNFVVEEIKDIDQDSIESNSRNLDECTETVDKSSQKDSIERQCRLCNIKFEFLKEYQAHYRQVHRGTTLCPVCGKFITKHSMTKHMTSHTKAKKHLCTECGKGFTLDENLKKHWRIHTGDKRYTCEYCGEKFIHWNSKRSHVRTNHTGEKKYECNICNKRFAQSSNMFRHIRQHTGELPHECSYCMKKFMTTTELRNHLVVHTKEKNEICEVCQKPFGTRKAKLAHLKTHTGERNYVCIVCKKAFTQAHVLRTHMKTHPKCPIPPPGVVLSQKMLNKTKKAVIASDPLVNEHRIS